MGDFLDVSLKKGGLLRSLLRNCAFPIDSLRGKE